MSGGKGAELRAHARARRIYRLSKEGLGTQEIARIVGVEPERIKALRELGERLVEATT